MKKNKKLKTRVNRLSIIVLTIMVIFVATASFNILSANSSLNETPNKDDIGYENIFDGPTDVTTKKNFKTADEAYRYAIKNLQNVKEYQYYVTNGILDVDLISGLKFIGNMGYCGKKDVNNNTYSKIIFYGKLGNIAEIAEYYDACLINNTKYYFRHTELDQIDISKLQLKSEYYNNGDFYNQVSKAQMVEDFNIEPSEIIFKVDSSTIKSRKISYTGYEYIVNFELDSEPAIEPLNDVIKSMMRVDYSYKANNFNLSCRIDNNGFLKSMLATGKLVINVENPLVSGIPISIDLKVNIVFDYSEGSGYIPLPIQER